MTRGLIVSWLPRLGYGFIRYRDTLPRTKDIYFHATVVEGGDAAIYKNAAVEFELNPHGGARPAATFVRVLKPATAQTASAQAPKPAPVPKPVTLMRSAPTLAPAPKTVEPRELPPAVARALGLIDETGLRKTKRDRLSAHGR